MYPVEWTLKKRVYTLQGIILSNYMIKYRRFGGTMSKKLFKEKDIKILSKNKYIKNISEKAITYSDEFKKLFIEQSNKGILPRVIFESVGIDVDIIGKNRLKTFAYRWRKKIKKGELLEDNRKLRSGRTLNRDLSLEEQISRLEAKNKLLEAENELLKKADMIERGLITKL